MWRAGLQLRRGLPRSPGGEAWPRGFGAAPDVIDGHGSTGERLEATSSAVASPVVRNERDREEDTGPAPSSGGNEEALRTPRRGLPRAPGTEEHRVGYMGGGTCR